MKVKGEVKTESGNIFPAPALAGLKDPMWIAIPIIDKAYMHQGYEAILSCGTEPLYWHEKDQCFRFIHSLSSLHYRGLALDFSCAGLPMETIVLIHKEIESYLAAMSKYYQVIFESRLPHIHVEFDKR